MSDPLDTTVSQHFRLTDNPLQQWLLTAAERGASDLHLVDEGCPVVRIHGKLTPLTEEALPREQFRHCLAALMPRESWERFQKERNLDFALELCDGERRTRFRSNCFFAADQIGACFRVIREEIPDLEWAGFPRDLAERLSRFRNGLVIACGITGAGKTTTLAMILNLMCQRGGYRIITIEEPIEYVFSQSKNSVITQREVGRDVHSFDEGLKYALRQDPDVILVGEIRDRETAQTALRAAETGHLVFASLHTRDCKGAISRYADLFGQDAQQEVRSQLSVSLRSVISQHLLPSAYAEDKRVLALEVMFNTSPIAIAIRNGRLDTIDNSILTGRADGMLTLNESLRRHLQAGDITRETAEQFATDPSVLRS